ncbi:hypothetical protein [Paenibacillus xanthanilyticus]|uniref:Cell division protein FtsK n=1 Tax=Paenibacillus xanthanilyticus TaxID=1783531 RepID=A0ABV8K836_9BACL
MLQRPPGLPERPRFRYLTVVAPLIGLALTALAVCLYTPIPRRASSYLAIGFALIALIAVIAWSQLRRHQNRVLAYEREISLREAELASYQRAMRERMMRIRQEERDKLEDAHPEPSLCLERVALRISSVWEREPGDPDFLRLRTGIGTVPSRAKLIMPKREGGASDSVYASVQRLASEFRTLEDSPVWVDAARFGLIGIAGDEQAAEAFIRSLVIQLTTHHAPDEVKVAALFDERRSDAWSWLRWLPHSWDDAREYRFLFRSNGYRDETMERFLAELRRRRRAAIIGDSRKGCRLPTFVCLIPNSCAMDAHPEIGKLLLAESPPEGICTIVLAPSKEKLPPACHLVIELWPDHGAVARPTAMRKSAGTQEREAAAPSGRFTPDGVTLSEAERFARTLAPYRLQRSKERAADASPGECAHGAGTEDVRIGQLGLDGEKKPLAVLSERRAGAAGDDADASSGTAL